MTSKNIDDDKQAFMDAMANVTRLSRTKSAPTKKSEKPKVNEPIKSKSKTSLPPLQSRPSVICPQPYQPEVHAEDILSYQDPSINKTSWQQFRRGRYKWDLRLDLHGLTLLEAEAALEAMMFRAQTQGAKHLLIIHGKGSHDGNTPPIIKNWLWRWLRNAPHVLAIHSAPNHQGGAGAVLVWLKKH